MSNSISRHINWGNIASSLHTTLLIEYQMTSEVFVSPKVPMGLWRTKHYITSYHYEKLMPILSF